MAVLTTLAVKLLVPSENYTIIRIVTVQLALLTYWPCFARPCPPHSLVRLFTDNNIMYISCIYTYNGWTQGHYIRICACVVYYSACMCYPCILYVLADEASMQQDVIVGYAALGTAVLLLCVALCLVLVCAAVTCLKLMKARKRRESNFLCVLRTYNV